MGKEIGDSSPEPFPGGFLTPFPMSAPESSPIDKGVPRKDDLLVPTSSTTIPAPKDWVLSVSRLQFPDSTDQRLRELMDKNTEGELSAEERRELQALVEMSEELSLVRAEALQLLEGDDAAA